MHHLQLTLFIPAPYAVYHFPFSVYRLHHGLSHTHKDYQRHHTIFHLLGLSICICVPIYVYTMYLDNSTVWYRAQNISTNFICVLLSSSFALFDSINYFAFVSKLHFKNITDNSRNQNNSLNNNCDMCVLTPDLIINQSIKNMYQITITHETPINKIDKNHTLTA